MIGLVRLPRVLEHAPYFLRGLAHQIGPVAGLNHRYKIRARDESKNLVLGQPNGPTFRLPSFGADLLQDNRWPSCPLRAHFPEL